MPRGEAARLGELLNGFTSSHLPILNKALAIYAADKIDFVDATVLAIARHNGWHLETFDKALTNVPCAKQRLPAPLSGIGLSSLNGWAD